MTRDDIDFYFFLFGFISSIDLITERFLFLVDDSNNLPIRLLTVLADAYAQIGQAEKLQCLIEWAEEKKMKISESWKVRLTNECMASLGRYKDISNISSPHDRLIYIKALAKAGEFDRALYQLMTNFSLSKGLHYKCLKELKLSRAMILRMKKNESRGKMTDVMKWRRIMNEGGNEEEK